MLPVKKDQAVSSKSLFARTLTRFKAEKTERARLKARIGFVIDATASRAQSWIEAQAIQAEMFRAVSGIGALSLRLVHYGGTALADYGWQDDARAIAATMAQVNCVGGYTQILPALCALLEDADEWPNAVIIVGDAFEEDPEQIAPLAYELKEAGIKVFTFIEGYDDRAARAFQLLAELTGGRFARFGAALPLRDLCAGVALYTAGGESGLTRLGNKQVERLLLTGPGHGTTP